MKQVVDTSQSILLAESVKPDILNTHFSGLNGVSALDAGTWFNFPVVYELRAFSWIPQ
jgi:hypothetical protein